MKKASVVSAPSHISSTEAPLGSPYKVKVTSAFVVVSALATAMP